MKPAHLCPTKYCRRRKAPKKLQCSRCAMRAWRAKNEMKARLAMLRCRAAAKHLTFDLTLEWLDWFCAKYKYNPLEHHIDRISAGKGYVMGNLQVLPISDNIAKGNRERWGQLQIL